MLARDWSSGNPRTGRTLKRSRGYDTLQERGPRRLTAVPRTKPTEPVLIPGWVRWIAIALFLLIMAGAASRLARASRARSSLTVAERLRDDLVGLRGQIDACLSTRDQSEIRFQSFADETQRLRTELDSIESLDSRGVPAEVYDEYMGRVGVYNEAVERWEAEAESLEELAARCDSIIVVHNEQAEALQNFLVGEGIWEEAWLEEGAGPSLAQ